MSTLNERLADAARAAGAPLIGFAPMARFDDAPPRFHPRTIFPQAKTVVAIAIPQPRGALKAVEEGAYWQAYN